MNAPHSPFPPSPEPGAGFQSEAERATAQDMIVDRLAGGLVSFTRTTAAVYDRLDPGYEDLDALLAAAFICALHKLEGDWPGLAELVAGLTPQRAVRL